MDLEVQFFNNFWGGKVDDALEIIDEIKRHDEIKGRIYTAYTDYLHGKMTHLYEMITPILEEDFTDIDILDKLKLKVVHARALLRDGKVEDSIEVLDKLLSQFDDLGNQNDKTTSIWMTIGYSLKGKCFFNQNEYDQGIHYMYRAIEIAEQKELSYFISKLYSDLGSMYAAKWSLDEGIAMINKSIEIALKAPNAPLCCQYGNMAEILLMQGKLDEAVKYGEQALEIIDGKCNLYAISCYESVLASIYYKMGDNDRASFLLSNCMKTRMQLQWYIGVASDLKSLIVIELSRDNIEKANFYNRQLQDLYTQTKTERIKYHAIFSKALILMQTKRVNNLAKSQSLFRELLKIENLYPLDKIDIYLQLSTLLIYELKIADDEEVVKELTVLTNEMYKIAEKIDSNSLIAEVQTIKANIELIRGNVDLALELVQKAKSTINDMGQKRLQDRIANFEREIKNNYMEWKKILSNSSFSNKIEKSMIEQYIASSLKMVERYGYYPS